MTDENKRLKMAIVSGASHAIRFREENPRADENAVIQFVTSKASEILAKIDEEI